MIRDEHLDASISIASSTHGDAEEPPDGKVRPRCRPEHICAVIEGELEVNWPDVLARVACPALLIRATEPFGYSGFGPILTAQRARRSLALLRDARMVEVRGNHITMVFDPHTQSDRPRSRSLSSTDDRN